MSNPQPAPASPVPVMYMAINEGRLWCPAWTGRDGVWGMSISHGWGSYSHAVAYARHQWIKAGRPQPRADQWNATPPEVPTHE